MKKIVKEKTTTLKCKKIDKMPYFYTTLHEGKPDNVIIKKEQEMAKRYVETTVKPIFDETKVKLVITENLPAIQLYDGFYKCNYYGDIYICEV